MMLKSIIPFPIFAPLAPLSTAASPSNSGHSTTEVRFSRWNNANAEEFNRRRRTQQEIEDDIRRTRRFQSAENIVNIFDSDGLSPPSTSTRTSTVASKSNYLDRNPSFRSIGTPSTPSSPSIPGKKSKYSKPLNYNPIRQATSEISHPAFRKLKKKPIPQQRNLEQDTTASAETVKVSEDGVSYLVPEAPFEYMYSYTETPKVKPLALREPPVTPFGPGTMPRPWTGRKPLPPSKKKLPEFDSFVSPPNKKGVKPVQKPGPFLPGSGPKYVWKREEILGDPLTWEEVREMVESCRKTKRQLNMGRDGFTHNMLENIHAHWKRRRVCKIKCKGVCTVDMDNVCQQLEEKTGGTIIYRKGGVLYLFRGRNYNYKTRPRYPLMLWKPVTPVYPRLIKQVPEGLTWEEATEMRAKGRQLVPICRLAKNGVYDKLVENVKEAFEACELVRIDCQGLYASDYRRIGAKLKDLVPCVLISFENEHILVWRGKDWKSSLFVQPLDSKKNNPRFMGDGFINLSSSTDQTVVSPCSEVQQETMSSSLQEVEMLGTIDVTSDPSLDVVSLKNFNTSENDDRLSTAEDGVATPVNDSYDLSSKAVGVESPVNDSTSSEVAVGAVSPVIDSQSSEVAVGAVCPVNNSTSSEGAVGAVSSVKDSASSEVAVGAVSPVTDSPSSEVAVGAVSPVDDSPSSEVAVGAVSPVDDSPSSEVAVGAVSPVDDSLSSEVVVGAASPVINGDINSNNIHGNETITNSSKLGKEDDYKAVISGSGQDGNEFSSSEENGSDVPSTSTSPYFQKVQSLLRQAVESGSALILDDSIQDADAVYKRSVVFSRHAPLMPEYRRKQRKVAVQNAEGQEVEGGQVEMEKEFVPGIETQVKSTTKTHKKKEFPKDCDGAAPQGSLGVDELAKLLA